jgi:long-chain fatty acid transport protein
MVGVLTGVFNTQATFAGCVPERFLCAPEQPSWDVLSQLSVGPIVAPTGEVGVTWVPSPKWRIGAAFQLPVWVRAHATLKARLPTTPVFEKASQQGEGGSVAFDLPWMARLGVEMRAVENLRLELAANYDRWSMHDTIKLTPEGIAFKNIAGFPATYNVPPVTLERHFQDSMAVHLGGEYRIRAGGLDWDARAGVAFETSAVPKAYESVLTIDQNKVTAALGGSLHYKRWRFDVTYAHVFGFNVEVDPKDAKIALVSPVQATAPKRPDIINGGSYSARADVIGLGLAYTWDAGHDGAASGPKPPAPSEPMLPDEKPAKPGEPKPAEAPPEK